MSYEPVDHFGFPNLNGKTVLVLDDNHDSALFLAELLEFCGAKVWMASSAAHARQWLNAGRRFSLIVCDFQMPRETGTDFMRWLRSQPDDGATVPAIAVTAYPKEFRRSAHDAHVFDASFVKPLDAPKFLRTVATILSRPREQKSA